MLESLLLIIQLIILFLLAQSFAKHFFLFWFLITKSKDWSMRICSLVLLPGTFIHEISHWLVAEMVQVPTGKISLWPQYTDDGDGIKMGSVQIAQTDPFRRTIIGLAPLFVGVLLLGLIAQTLPQPLWSDISLLLFGYLGIMFLISNTMFSSKKDLEVALGPFILIILLIMAWWFFEWPSPAKLIQALQPVINKLNSVFLITIAINIFFLLLVRLLTTLFQRILRRHIIRR